MSLSRLIAPKSILALAAFPLLFLGGCAGTPEEIELETEPPEEMYREAWNNLNGGNYRSAIQVLQRIEARYPFGEYATQAHLDLLYAHKANDDPASVAEEADRFVRENPRHEAVPYSYYMKGVAHYELLSDPLEWLFDIDRARRNPENTIRAFRAFKQLVDLYPDSQYADDARLRMIELRNRLARHEWYVADFYLSRGSYVAAANRANHALENYPRAAATPWLLDILARSYEQVDLTSLAADTRKVLETNFPDFDGGKPPGIE